MKIRVFFVLVFILICAFSPAICAEESESIEQTLEGLEGMVADSIGNDAVDGLFSEGLEGQSLLSRLEPSRLWSAFVGALSVGLGQALSMLCTIGGILIISSACGRICSSLSGGALEKGFAFCSSVALMSAMIGGQSAQIGRVESFFDSLGRLLGGMIPVTGIVWAMGGNIGTASVGTATLYALLGATHGICAATLKPVCCVMGISAICSGLSEGELLGGFTGAVKKTYNFFVAAIMTVVVFALGAQTAIAGAADTAAARGAKLLSSSIIPVVGGAVGDTLRTVSGSVQYIKSIVGIGGMLLVLALTLPTFISVLLSRTVFLISSAFAQMLGCKREARLLDELGNVYGCVLGAVSISSVAFIVALGIFVKCVVAAS